MRRLLKALFAPEYPLSQHVHYHLDDQGERRFCDESACRPTANRPAALSQLLFPPPR